MKAFYSKFFLLLILSMMLIGVVSCATQRSIAREHPIKGLNSPNCSNAGCHTNEYALLNHKNDYLGRHKFMAAQNRLVCITCHQESFCNDCHSRRDEIKPSDKLKDDPDHALPHRGDYMFQHRIDGKVNPASCVRCHGRTNNERCATCHK